MNILPQITQIPQTNAASCIIPQRKAVSFEVKDVLSFWGFVCVNLRDQRETSGVSFVQYRLSTLACYSPADYTDHAERNAAKLHYFAEKDSFV